MMAECTKRRFGGKHDARLAHRKCGYRLRVYRCQDCRGWHVTNSEKRHRAENRNEK